MAARKHVKRTADQTIPEPARAATDPQLDERHRDKDFKERLRRRHEEERALYERLAS